MAVICAKTATQNRAQYNPLRIPFGISGAKALVKKPRARARVQIGAQMRVSIGPDGSAACNFFKPPLQSALL